MSFDFGNLFEVLSSCKNQDDIKSLLLRHNFTVRYCKAKQESDTGLTEIDNEFVYVVKRPYQDSTKETTETKEVPEKTPEELQQYKDTDAKLALLHQFGRGLVFRVNFNSETPTFSLMSVPLPFGNEKYLEENELSQSVVTGLVDGTGFNVSVDPISGVPFISTRACGDYYPEGPRNYFTNPNHKYGDMIKESLDKYNVTLDTLKQFNGLSIHMVMLHPYDLKIYPVDEPNLYLINVFKIEGYVVTPMSVDEFQTTFKTTFMKTVDLGITEQNAFDDILKYHSPKIIPGVKLFNPTTGVWSKRILTQPYERIKELYGNDTNIVFTLIRLRYQEGQYRKTQHQNGLPVPDDHKSLVTEFLEYFPEYSNIYKTVSFLCKEATSEIFDNYLRVFTQRGETSIKDKLNDVPYEFRDLVQKVHNDYLTKRTEYQTALDACETDEEKSKLYRPKTTHHSVMGFFNNLAPALIYDRIHQFVNRKQSNEPDSKVQSVSKYFPAKVNATEKV